MMRPAQVLDIRASLLDYLDTTAYQGELGRRSVSPPLPMAQPLTARHRAAGAALSGRIATSLRAAQAFHVQATMVPVVLTAAADLADDDFVSHELLPAEQGFLVFDVSVPSPVPWPDGGVRESRIGALTWSHGGDEQHRPGIWVDFWTNIDDPRDAIWSQWNATRPGWRDDWVTHMGSWWHTGRLHVPYRTPVGPYAVTAAQYARLLDEPHLLAFTEPDDRPVLNHARLLVALIRLLTQVLVEVSEAPVDRATVRRSQRKNLPMRVQTIALRRKDTGTHLRVGTGQVQWQHSWVVRGSWQWRHCGPDHPAAEEYAHGHHARVYVPPFFKGPPDKPLLVTEKVWDLSR